MSDEEQEDDFEEDEEYEYDDGEDEGDTKATSPREAAGAIKLLDHTGLIEAQRRQVATMSEYLGLSPDNALALAHSERWPIVEILVEKWQRNPDAPEAMAKTAGICLSPLPPSAAPDFECPICKETKPSAEGFALGCGHMSCSECWSDGLKTYAGTADCLRSTCMSAGCQLVVPASVFQRFLGPAEYAKTFERWSIAKFVECSKKRLRTCPKPGCALVAFRAQPPDSSGYHEVDLNICDSKSTSERIINISIQRSIQ